MGQGRGGKKRDRGRAEWSRTQSDRRSRNEEDQAAKRRKLDSDGNATPVLPSPFSREEIASEERRPKHKVAVLIGYSGSGYKGMQLNTREKTIEGDLFNAFVTAGAISKANADDPKKSSLVRCARTDKGVHASGNIISLKLIVQDEDIVQKINDNLTPQIRVWGIERTNSSFSCYQLCDSRIYEYLIPTYAFLPPHPRSHLAKKLVELAEQAGDARGLKSRQEEIASFWSEAKQTCFDPVLADLDLATRETVLGVVFNSEAEESESHHANGHVVETSKDVLHDGATEEQTISQDEALARAPKVAESGQVTERPELMDRVRRVKTAYIAAKKGYRISPARLQRVRDALALYHGVRNFHNYTPDKSFHDPSAKRLIKSFVADEPIIIDGTEWVSLKVHGQSFMMHQIRKMVAMVAMVVRSGCVPDRITESYGPTKLSIPRAPGLGLLLERPVFDSYNQRAVKDLQRERIDFGKYDKEMTEFKQREIYDRIFREEQKENQYHAFFAHVDSFRGDQFLYLTSVGVPAAGSTAASKDKAEAEDARAALDSGSEGDARGQEEG